MEFNVELIESFYKNMDERSRESLDKTIDAIVTAKKRGGRVAVVTGSGPNIHEGVTTLVAELINKGIVDAVTTSSAVVAHEMAGTLDRVKMCDASQFDLDASKMPRGNVFEFTCLSDEELAEIMEGHEDEYDLDFIRRGMAADGHYVIKAAGNMAYPMGLRIERFARWIGTVAHRMKQPFEFVVGWGCDRRTMLGAGVANGVPVLVTLPQMVGGGAVGLAIGDSVPISHRASQVAKMLGSADVIVESAVALTQEIHDGPFETYTGHGIWAWWQGKETYSLDGKVLARIDLDENLRRARDVQMESALIQEAIAKGLPKTKVSKIPFRMEMSAFSRLENSYPIIGDIGEVWPVLAYRVARELDIKLDFMSYKQETDDGKAMREWIVDNIKPVDFKKVVEWRKESTRNRGVRARKTTP